MRRVLFTASWYPKGPHDPAGSFIASQADAMSSSCDVRVIDCTETFSVLPRSWRNRRKVRGIIESLERDGWKPDLIHAHVAYPAGVIALALKDHYRVPVILTEHTGPLRLLVPYFKKEKAFFEHYRSYDRVISVSEYAKRDLLSGGVEFPVTVVGNIVRDIFLKAPMPTEVPQATTLFVGGLTESKGIVDLFKALEVYDRWDVPELDFHFVGDGPLKSWALERAEAFRKVRIEFHKANMDELLPLYMRASFLSLPSRGETFSLVAAEAIAMGRPVLGFACGGPEDFVGEERGILLPRRDPEELAVHLKSFASEPRWMLSDEVCEKRRRYMAEHFSGAVIGRKLDRIYVETLSS